MNEILVPIIQFKINAHLHSAISIESNFDNDGFRSCTFGLFAAQSTVSIDTLRSVLPLKYSVVDVSVNHSKKKQLILLEMLLLNGSRMQIRLNNINIYSAK